MSNIETSSNTEVQNNETVVETTIASENPVPAVAESNSAEIEAIKQQKLEQKKAFLAKLISLQQNDTTIEVEIIGVVKGGLRVSFEGELLFLPASFYDSNKYTSEELEKFVGQKVNVKIIDVNADPNMPSIPVVNRKLVLESEVYDRIKVGDIVSGPITSVATFGAFVDLGGAEGLIHISRLAHHHVKDPKSVVKKGDVVTVKVIEVEKANKRIALSKKDLEASPWDEIEAKFPIGSICKGIVRRMTDFGAYVELAPGVDGLVRNNELSWTTRINKPSDILKIGDEKEFFVMTNSAQKSSITLSYRRLTENPWESFKDKYVHDFKAKATIKNVHDKGALVTVGDEQIDAFMPKSKILNSAVEITDGAEIDVYVIEVVPEKESLIVRPEQLAKEESANSEERPERSERPRREGNFNRGNRDRDSNGAGAFAAKGNETFTLGDLLSKASADTLSTIK